MHASHAREASHMPDDARGSVQIWRVEDYELVDWPKSRYGIFFQGDSYVILYTYGKQNDRFIIYYWLVSWIQHLYKYHTIQYYTTPYHTMSYHTISHHTIAYHITPYHTTPPLPYGSTTILYNDLH